MKQKLEELVTRIELSDLKEEEKDELYRIISEGLHETVWPILYKHMPKEKLDELRTDPSKITIDQYISLLDEATKDGKAFKELDEFMMDILERVDNELKKHNI